MRAPLLVLPAPLLVLPAPLLVLPAPLPVLALALLLTFLAPAGSLPAQAAAVEIAPRGGPVGTDVTVRMEGLPAETPMIIGFGAPRGGYEWIGRATTDAAGALRATVAVPASAAADQVHYFFVTRPEEPPLGNSPGFHVTMADGRLRVTGELRRDAGGRLLLAGTFDELYCLSGEVAGLVTGTRARVEGVIARDAAACPAGIPLEVRGR